MSKLDIAKGIADKLNKKLGEGEDQKVFVASGNEEKLDFGVIPTGIVSLDEALGGGFARGTAGSLAGNEGTGKTCLCMDIIAHNQKLDPEFLALYANFESKQFPLVPAIKACVDLNRLLVLVPYATAERSFDAIMKFLWKDSHCPSNLLDLLVIDSVAATIPTMEMNAVDKDGLEKSTVGRQAAMMSKFLRVVLGSGSLGTCMMLLVNQYRTDVGGYGGYILPGGKAVIFYSKQIVKITAPKGQYIYKGPKADGIVMGHVVTGEVSKNNTGRGFPHTRFSYPVIYGEGVDPISPLLDVAVKKGVIDQVSSAWFQLEIGGELVKVHGRPRLETMLREDEELFDRINLAVNNILEDKTLSEVPEVAEELLPENQLDLTEELPAAHPNQL